VFFLGKIRENITKWAIFGLFFVFLMLIASQVRAELYPPMAEPPGNNTSGFIDISDIDQGKQGPLRLGTGDVASQFNYQLEVLGGGAAATRAEIDNDLQVAQNASGLNQAFFVDSVNNRVCIGDCFNTEGSKLEVSDRGTSINYTETIGNALAVYSDQAEAFYSQGATGGFYALSDGVDNYSIYTLSTTGTALTGNNPSGTYSAVAGVSTDGIAIYGTNLNYFGLWSAYFDGRLQGNTDISAAKLVTKNKLPTLFGHTYGQVVESFDFGNSQVIYHDGTYLWLASGSNIIKVRASDGLQVYSSPIGTGISEIVFDDKNYWVVYDSGISKINSSDGTVECTAALSNPSGFVFTGREYWATAAGTGEIIEINESCGQVAGSTYELVNETSFTLGKAIYSGDFIWALATNNDSNAGSVISFNPSSGDAIRWDGLIGRGPVDIYYDNYYFWTLNEGSDTVSQYYMQKNKVCSQLAAGDRTFSCQTDTDCEDAGLGSCTFHKPQIYVVYPINYESSHTENNPINFVFSSEDIWINNNWTDSGGSNFSELIKMSLYNPGQTETIAVSGNSTGLVFDQSYLWVSTSDDDLYKIFSGVGYGHDDLSDTLALQSGSYTDQRGSFDISGHARIDDTLNSEGDLTATNNIWGKMGPDDLIFSTEWEPTSVMPTPPNPCQPGQSDCFATGVSSLIQASDGYIYAGTFYDGNVYRSNDGGMSWEDTGVLPINNDEVTWVEDLIETHDGTIYAAYGNEIGVPDDGARVAYYDEVGGNWIATAEIIDPAISNHAYSLIEVQEGAQWAIYVAVHSVDYLFKTTDGGVNWNSTSSFPARIGGNDDVDILLNSSDGFIYTGSKTSPYVNRSDDGGVTWENMTDISTVAGIYSLYEASDGCIYAGTDQISGIGNGHVFQSCNNGHTWQDTGVLTNSEAIYSIIEIDNVLYATSKGSDGNGHVFWSMDWGDTWVDTSIPVNSTEVIEIIQGSDGTLYLGARNGGFYYAVYRSMALDPNTDYHCPNGHFVKNIKLNGLKQVIRIECGPL